MNNVQIKIVAPFKAKDKTVFTPGEKYTARRITLGVLDIKTPFQIVDGTQSGYEIPYKNAIVLKEEKTYTHKQYDEILAQRDEALAQLETVLSDLAKHGQTIVELQDERLLLLNTIERAVTHNEIQPLPREVVQALETLKRDGENLDTVIGWMLIPSYQGCVNIISEISTLRNYAFENGWKLINGMINGYVVEPQLEDPAGIAETVLEWWKERDIDAKESDLDNLVDRLKGRIAEQQTVQ
ncbi:hypothetical protein PAECIP112173_00382 [Paenibacillus sp. JJ-100]|uniref:hypothetical protein n=1 Tax=Paenibacillus sp. JJ-100 TaxID=2974896 RepID=UPI0022FF530B|nr:hypothetical protein [Paenibacillus sp. JJ-100]CAI6024394.1 hypothetical protein PAECIP112173_00382 [Paenibacillus sp. JJ-100]